MPAKVYLHIKNPELLKEWDYDRNDLSPEEIFPGQTEKVWWNCPNLANEFVGLYQMDLLISHILFI